MIARTPKLSIVPKAPGLGDLQGIVRGYCTDKDARKALIAHGLQDRLVYLDGSGAEDFGACLRSFRGRPGYLVVAQDLSLFGLKKRLVADHTDALERLGVRIIDIAHPQDKTYAAMLQRANVTISGSVFHKNVRLARRVGRAGGFAKGMAAELARNELVPAWLLDRLVDNKRISWDDKVALVEPHISRSGLRRHYGTEAALKRA
jgi:hypothetical protein